MKVFRQQRLDHVVEQMRETDGRENREYGSLGRLLLRFDFDSARAHVFQLSMQSVQAELFGDQRLIRTPPRAVVVQDVYDENFFSAIVTRHRLNRLANKVRRACDYAAAWVASSSEENPSSARKRSARSTVGTGIDWPR